MAFKGMLTEHKFFGGMLSMEKIFFSEHSECIHFFTFRKLYFVWLSMLSHFYRMLSLHKNFLSACSACVKHFLSHPQQA